MSTLETLPDDLPWQLHAYLLLDGVSVNNLQARVREWFGTPEIQLLYATTALAPCNEISPCLITLNGPNTSGLGHYLAHSGEEWGYLIFSQASGFDVIRHLRRLLNAQYQPQGLNVWLRIADPAVMHAVLSHATETRKPDAFGPMERVVLPDVISNGWHHHARPEGMVRGLPDGPYGVCEAQQAKLDDVSFRAGIRSLEKHLNAKIPEYRSDLTGAARWQWLREMAIRADGLGFSSDHDLCFYANVYGLLGDDVLRDHPDIAALITQPSGLTPSDRIKKAADMALVRNGNYEAFV